MTTAVTTTNGRPMAAAVEDAMVQGDLSKLSSEQRIAHYKAVCESLGLNPLTRPFQYITFNSMLQLYARREASDQLAALHRVDRRIVAKSFEDGLYVVTVRATTPDGRVEESTGVVPMEGLKGEARANALMKGETKAKRRATLSIVGLGWLDETEVESIRGARYVTVDERGDIVGARPVAPAIAAPAPNAARAAFGLACKGLSRRQVCGLLGIETGSDTAAAIDAAANAYGWELLTRCIEDQMTVAVALRDEPGAQDEPAGDPDDLPFDAEPEIVGFDDEGNAIAAAQGTLIDSPRADPVNGRRH